MPTRRGLSLLVILALVSVLRSAPAREKEPDPTSPESLATAARAVGLEFTDAELRLMVGEASRSLSRFKRLRAVPLDNGVAPALTFAPGIVPRKTELAGKPHTLPEAERPEKLDDLAFAGITTLASLIKSKKVSCVELTKMYLARLKRLDEKLRCVITVTEDRALAQAKALDAELAAGKWRGLLHGIPWGAKDLLATKGYRTTWGAKPFENQMIDTDATVVERLDAAGAILIAKLTLGALAMGDVWFGATTRNPWNLEQGSSGSSAGPASATAAGCVAFSIGSETLGSIVSPSERCGNSSLRPTFGRISRHGAMTLCWSMDKLGPICRSAEDAAIVFEAIHGRDGKDLSVVDAPVRPNADVDIKGWKVGFLPRHRTRSSSYRRVLGGLQKLGVELVEVKLPDYPVDALRIILNAECAAAFDEITRDGRDDQLVRQTANAWPNLFRTARLIPAVEYINANRVRTLLIRDWVAAMQKIDVLVHPSFAGDILVATNLTGHPTFVAPAGFRPDGTPYGISFTGRLMEDDRLLALVQAWQQTTGFHKEHPDL